MADLSPQQKKLHSQISLERSQTAAIIQAVNGGLLHRFPDSIFVREVIEQLKDVARKVDKQYVNNLYGILEE